MKKCPCYKTGMYADLLARHTLGLASCAHENEVSYGGKTPTRWEEIDRAIVRFAKTKAERAVREGELLLAAKRNGLHRRFGFASLTEYVEHRLGYDPRTTLEKLRVAEALERLPKIRGALERGERHPSCVRELVRVAVPETEAQWLAASEARTVRDVERMVSGRAPGDLPSTPRDPRLTRHKIVLELDAESFAVVQEALDQIRKDSDPSLEQARAFAAICRAYLGESNPDGRSPYQVRLTKCTDCERVSQESCGQDIEVPEEVGERACCDADLVNPRGNLSKTIPAQTRRAAMRRAKGCCEVPGCRNRRWLDVHHDKIRCEGHENEHDLEFLIVLCDVHHQLNHRGLLWIEGDRKRGLVFKHADGTLYGRPTPPENIEVFRLAFSALRNLGIPESRTKQALAEAKTHVGQSATVEEVITAALRASRAAE